MMKRMIPLQCGFFVAAIFWLIATPLFAGQSTADAPLFKQITLPNGITLHYVEQGSGAPVIFVHGSLSAKSMLDLAGGTLRPKNTNKQWRAG